MTPSETNQKSVSRILRIDNAFECTIIERLNRFVVRVKEGGKLRMAHTNNTGRLHEFLIRGRKGFCMKTGKHGKTDCRLFAVEERGLGALIDTQFQMKSFENLVETGRIPWLQNFVLKKRNVQCDYVTGDVMKIKLDRKFDFILDRGCFHHITKKDKPEYVRLVHQSLKKRGKFYLLCFSDKNPPFEKNLSREDIKRYFSDDFHILFIKHSVHTEPSSGQKRHLYAVFMERKN